MSQETAADKAIEKQRASISASLLSQALLLIHRYSAISPLYRLLLFLGIAFLSGFAFIAYNPSISLSWQLPMIIEKTNEAADSTQNIRFRFPASFQLDTDTEKRYGKDYLAGFRLSSDRRTGCDIRSSEMGLNFSKSDADIASALEKQLSASAKNFHLIKNARVHIGKDPAFMVDFSFVDPLGDTTRITQIFITHSDTNYLIACGANDSLYRFFDDSFSEFFESIRFK